MDTIESIVKKDSTCSNQEEENADNNRSLFQEESFNELRTQQKHSIVTQNSEELSTSLPFVRTKLSQCEIFQWLDKNENYLEKDEHENPLQFSTSVLAEKDSISVKDLTESSIKSESNKEPVSEVLAPLGVNGAVEEQSKKVVNLPSEPVQLQANNEHGAVAANNIVNELADKKINEPEVQVPVEVPNKVKEPVPSKVDKKESTTSAIVKNEVKATTSESKVKGSAVVAPKSSVESKNTTKGKVAATTAKQTNGTAPPPKSASSNIAKAGGATNPIMKKASATSVTSPVKASPPGALGGSPARPGSRRTSAPQTPTGGSSTNEEGPKKLPMNKVKVGAVPSPNLKEVKSKVGSFSAVTRKPTGGNVKIPEQKLTWKAESKVGSLTNVNYTPKGGNVKVESKKIEVKQVTSKVGSLQNVKHKPGGGEKKIFDDKDYLKNSAASSEHGGSGPSTPRPTSSAANNDGEVSSHQLKSTNGTNQVVGNLIDT